MHAYSGPPAAETTDRPWSHDEDASQPPVLNVPNNPISDNFNAGDALERLYSGLVDVEALAHAAGEAVTLLPSTASPKAKRSFARLYALVTKTANEASAALTLSEQLVSALSVEMAVRRAIHEFERGTT